MIFTSCLREPSRRLTASFGGFMSSKIQVKAGNILIGGGAPISVQSMLNVPSTDIEGSVAQAKRLEDAGCQIIRAAIPDMDAVRLIPALKEAVGVPIVADIHFNTHKNRRQLRLARKGDPRKVRPSHASGALRQRALSRFAARKIRLRRHRALNEELHRFNDDTGL